MDDTTSNKQPPDPLNEKLISEIKKQVLAQIKIPKHVLIEVKEEIKEQVSNQIQIPKHVLGEAKEEVKKDIYSWLRYQLIAIVILLSFVGYMMYYAKTLAQGYLDNKVSVMFENKLLVLMDLNKMHKESADKLIHELNLEIYDLSVIVEALQNQKNNDHKKGRNYLKKDKRNMDAWQN